MSLIRVNDLTIDFNTSHGPVRALSGVNLTAEAGERIAIVGESGSGKSTLGSSLGALLPSSASTVRGGVRIGGDDLAELSRDELRRLRRDRLGFIPQDPIATLDPTKRVGRQLAFVVGDAGGDTSQEALCNLLTDVRINEPESVLRRFPHQLSGGMAQRVAIAIAMVRRPAVLIADEPTAALDANVRREVLALIFEIARESGSTVLWLTHDLDAVSKWCERAVVMYRGEIVEDGAAAVVLNEPDHPYTRSLLAALPSRLVRGEEIRTYTEMLKTERGES